MKTIVLLAFVGIVAPSGAGAAVSTLDRVRAYANEYNAHGVRDRRALVRYIRSLIALGAEAEPALIKFISDAKVTDPALPGVVEALGRLHAEKAAPFYRQLVDEAEAPSTVRRSAAVALGRLCRSEDVAFLAGRGRQPHQRLAALSGLGFCRSQPAMNALLEQLTSADANVRRSTIDALGFLGSSWAWQAMPAERHREGEQIRLKVGAGLQAAMRNAETPSERVAIAEALQMVGP